MCHGRACRGHDTDESVFSRAGITPCSNRLATICRWHGHAERYIANARKWPQMNAKRSVVNAISDRVHHAQCINYLKATDTHLLSASQFRRAAAGIPARGAESVNRAPHPPAAQRYSRSFAAICVTCFLLYRRCPRITGKPSSRDEHL